MIVLFRLRLSGTMNVVLFSTGLLAELVDHYFSIWMETSRVLIGSYWDFCFVALLFGLTVFFIGDRGGDFDFCKFGFLGPVADLMVLFPNSRFFSSIYFWTEEIFELKSSNFLSWVLSMRVRNVLKDALLSSILLREGSSCWCCLARLSTVPVRGLWAGELEL